jgi:integrase/recombinase XerD
VLERPKVVADLPRRKQTRTLPTVLTPDEVARLFTALGATALRAVLMLAYGAGLRIGEACRLRMQDINSRAGVIHVRSTKRNRDRDVMLRPTLLAELRAYWRWRRPAGPELFPGRAGAGTTLTRAAVSKALKKKLTQAGLSGRRITVQRRTSSSKGPICARYRCCSGMLRWRARRSTCTCRLPACRA